MSKELLVQGELSAHLMHGLSWNLCARASNTYALRLSHLAWENDSLKVYMTHQKNDLDGEKQGKHTKRVYYSPDAPEICLVFVLATYLACTECGEGKNTLFPKKMFMGFMQLRWKGLTRKMEHCWKPMGSSLAIIELIPTGRVRAHMPLRVLEMVL